MVNLGPSKACLTCKQRRIKCDEGKPSCQRCTRSRRVCGGYQKKAVSIRFKHDLIEGKAKLPPTDRQAATLVVASRRPIPALRPVERDVAISFFLSHFAGRSRHLEPARGFFETLAPMISRELPSSAVSVAVTAVATRLHRLWRDGASLSDSSSCLPQTLGFALSRLRQALQDESESKSSSTVLAALVLQFYENLSAVWGQRQPNNTHHQGAVALFMHQSLNMPSTVYSPAIVASILNNEVLSAICCQRPVPPNIRSWITAATIPLNPGSTLDLVGLSVADVQHRFIQTMHQDTDDWLYEEMLDTLWLDIKSVDDDLLGWVETLPGDLHPVRLQQVKDANPPIVTYSSGSCDIYTSIKIASLWNKWRCYRIMLLHMAMILLHSQSSSIPTTNTVDGHDPSTRSESALYIDGIQELVDSICDSVAYHLGNHRHRATLHDLTDPNIAHPSYHDLPVDGNIFIEFLESDRHMSFDDHKRHVIARGSWHILSPLTYLAERLSGKYGELLQRALRPGQHEWIEQQIARASVILDLRC